MPIKINFLQSTTFRNYHTLTLILGSNLGDKLNNIKIALEELQSNFGKPIITSSFYETAAWGNIPQPSFLNVVAQYNTKINPFKALEIALNIEEKMGRVRTIKMGPRIIDIDLLFYGNSCIQSPFLTIPHPHISQRKFVLLPLAEIDAHFTHPTLQKTMLELLISCSDTLDVKKFIIN